VQGVQAAALEWAQVVLAAAGRPRIPAVRLHIVN
jgi:hypothetical protein